MSMNDDVDWTKWKVPEFRFVLGINGRLDHSVKDKFGIVRGFINTKSEVPFRVIRFTLNPECCLEQLYIEEMIFGRLSYQGSAEPIPASVFARGTCVQCQKAGSEHLFGVQFPALQAGIPIALGFQIKKEFLPKNGLIISGSFECEDLSRHPVMP